MKKISLKFEDILQIIEFIQYTKCHQYSMDEQNIIVTSELSEAEIELAINGYGASEVKE